MNDGAAFALERLGLLAERQKSIFCSSMSRRLPRNTGSAADVGAGALAFDVEEAGDFGTFPGPWRRSTMATRQADDPSLCSTAAATRRTSSVEHRQPATISTTLG